MYISRLVLSALSKVNLFCINTWDNWKKSCLEIVLSFEISVKIVKVSLSVADAGFLNGDANFYTRPIKQAQHATNLFFSDFCQGYFLPTLLGDGEHRRGLYIHQYNLEENNNAAIYDDTVKK